jgi:hypothetical protein
MGYLNYAVQGFIALAGLYLSWQELRNSLSSGKWLRFMLVAIIPLATFLSIYLTYKSDNSLASDLSSTEQNLNELKNYNYVATLTYNGADTEYFTASDPNHPNIPPGLPTLLLGTYQITSRTESGAASGVEYNCDAQSQQKYLQAIALNPDYPFSYYALATCQKQSNDSGWLQNAKKALAIFQITTTIDGHSYWQDAGLQETTVLLKN